MTVSAPPPSPGADLRRWRLALVYGLGVSGRAAVRLLARRGVRVEGVDRQVPADLSRELPELNAYHREDRLASVPAGVDGLVLSPGVPPDRPLVEEARRRDIPVVAEVEVGWQQLRERAAGTVLAVTGSNGKSTTTALTGALLEAAGRRVRVCGNIGTPFSEAVLDEEDRTGGLDRGGAEECVFVVELSSFQAEGLHSFHPRAAAYLNLSPDHMDRYHSVDQYAAAKARLPALLGPRDTAVLNLDDERTATVSTVARKRFFTRRRRPGADFDDGCWLEDDRVMELDPSGAELPLFERSDLRLEGEHNVENAMAAALLARALGVRPPEIRTGLASFTGLPHRMEKVGELPLRTEDEEADSVGKVAGVVTFWNDSKGTNPAATLRSLEGFADRSVHLILGGRAKGTDFGVLAPGVMHKVRRLYLIGEAAEEIERALARVPVPVHRCGTLDRAVAEAFARILRERRRGDALLLSPACASFDQFRSFAHRGDEFRALVREHLVRSEGARDRGGDAGGNPGGDPDGCSAVEPPHTVDTTTEEARDGDQAGL